MVCLKCRVNRPNFTKSSKRQPFQTKRQRKNGVTMFSFHRHPTLTHRPRLPPIINGTPLVFFTSSNSTPTSRSKPLNLRSLFSPRPRPRPMGSLSALNHPLQYPTARRDVSVIDDYHGVKIADPYRWLEDPDAEEVKEFVQEQVTLTESVLKTCDTREKLREKITKSFDHPRYYAPFKRGNKYFYFYNTGLQAQDVLYVQDCLEGEPEVLLDPNGFSKDGTVSLNTLSISEDAKYLAYGLSTSGSDWITIKVMHVENKIVEADTLNWVKFTSISWTHDSKGFFYSRYPAPKEGENFDAGTETNASLYHELYYHFVGTEQAEDILCWRDPENPKYMFGAGVTDDGKYLLLYITESCDPVNKVYYCDMSAFSDGLEGFRGRTDDLLPFVKLIDNFDAQYQHIANDDTVFTFLANKDAPKYKIVRVDLKEPRSWIDVVSESEKDVLESACAVNGDKMIVSYLRDVKYVLQIRDLKTGSLLHQLHIDIGSVTGISARRKDSIVFISFASFLTPGIIYQCNLDTEVPDMKIFREITVPGFDRTEFQVNQVFVP
ncbi:hypothetical protein OIU84_013879 [Salix udensis]|uniref:Peptidase S9A N-terminal domain-containing protein n=1 Tax=Salix udensis TaxID=889485 RepID=A0AAD6NUL1_9ROSI|nr:hypothetical protein OIU84_013879 [Salix udensis]